MEAAEQHGIQIHRISQGSGVTPRRRGDRADGGTRPRARGRGLPLRRPPLRLGHRHPGDVGRRRPSGGRAAAVLRGADQLAYGIEDVIRGCELGERSVLVADIGQLWVLGRMRQSGDLPPDLEIKASISMPTANPAAARVLEDLGVTTINLPIDLTLAQIAAIRGAVDTPSTSTWRAPTTSAAWSATTRSRPLCGRRLPSTSSSPYGTRRHWTLPARTSPTWPWRPHESACDERRSAFPCSVGTIRRPGPALGR